MNELLLPLTGANGPVVVPGVYQGFNFDTMVSTGLYPLTPNTAVPQLAISPAMSGYSKMPNKSGASIDLAGGDKMALIGKGDFTIEFWGIITSTSNGYSTYLCLMSPSNTQILTIRLGDSGYGNRIQFSMNPYVQAEVYSCSLNRNAVYDTWRHIVVMRKNGLINLYVNGVQQSLANGTSTTYDNNLRSAVNYDMSAGTFWYTQAGTCRVEEFVVYNYAKRTQNVNFSPPVGGPLAK